MRLLFFMLCALALWGCSASRPEVDNADNDEVLMAGGGGRAFAMAAPAAAPQRAMMSKAVVADQAVMLESMDMVGAAQEGSVAEEPAPTPGTQTGRMVYYNGGIELKATLPEAVLDTAGARVLALGGYVESRNPNFAVLRVPVAHFRAFFEATQSLGVLQNKWMRADDITDAFQDNALRIKIGEATLARLHELLAASTNDDEKLRLLREIQRVNDELEQRKTRQEVLAKQAAYSRLELNVQPFVFETGRADLGIHAFAWFSQLNALRSQEPKLGKKAELTVPTGLVAIDSSASWLARSADGVDLWMFRRANEPRGTGAFWCEALRNSLAPSFAKADTFTVGEFSVLRLESFGPNAYVWWIAAHSAKKKLYIAEAYFPDLAAETRHGEAIRQSLAGGVQ
jgi:hypothetical protein